MEPVEQYSGAGRGGSEGNSDSPSAAGSQDCGGQVLRSQAAASP